METCEVTLPAGLFRDGHRQRTAALRPLLGHDERFLAERAGALSPAARTTAVLTRCLERLGDRSPVDEDAVRALTVGDRAALLLLLRRLTHGERLSLVLRCPNEACREAMDLDLAVADLLQPPYADAAAEHAVSVEDGGEVFLVCFRLPAGADQEAVATLALGDVERAARELLRRCVLRIEDENGHELDAGALPTGVVERIEQAMAQRDPQADLTLSLTCPACGASWLAPFDAGDVVARELHERQADLLREVHTLALHYHWSEAEILGLTCRRRRQYLDLIAESVSAWSDR